MKTPTPPSCPRPTRATPHLVVAHYAAHYADGERTTLHATKRAAHEHGMRLRRSGVVAFSYPASVAPQFSAAPVGAEQLLATRPLAEVLRQAAGAGRATVRPGGAA